ncbi:MAG: hypothetical protein MUE52_04485 [Tabrizicola sp.]|jgi:hypothetical protein|nr:hypothetical protein [Tabrizicola sp.]
MTPHRLPDWNPRLSAYLAEITPVAFRMGSQDCALFAAGAVRAMTGYDPAAPFRGTYTDLKSGLKRLRAAGFESHIEIADKLFQRIHPAMAQVGDLALIEVPDGMALGIVAGETLACLSPAGLGHLPRAAAVATWSVP